MVSELSATEERNSLKLDHVITLFIRVDFNVYVGVKKPSSRYINSLFLHKEQQTPPELTSVNFLVRLHRRARYWETPYKLLYNIHLLLLLKLSGPQGAPTSLKFYCVFVEPKPQCSAMLAPRAELFSVGVTYTPAQVIAGAAPEVVSGSFGSPRRGGRFSSKKRIFLNSKHLRLCRLSSLLLLLNQPI